MSALTILLDRLDRVSPAGAGYRASCPAHNDRSPSLAINESTAGRVLVKCFAGCTAAEIVGAVGLELKHLFPDSRLTPVQLNEYRQRKSREEIIVALYHEMLVLLQVLGPRIDGGDYPEDWWPRELIAVTRIEQGLREVYRG